MISDFDALRELFQQIDERAIHKEDGVCRLSPMARVCLGCQLLTGSTNTIGEFAGNRYFLDSVGVDEIPDANEIDFASVTDELITHFAITEIDVRQDEKREIAEIAVALLKVFNSGSQPEHVNFWTDAYDEEFTARGFIVLPDFLNSNMVDLYRKEAYRLATLEREKGSAFLYGYGNSAQRVYNLINKTDVFDELLLDARLETILKKIFQRPTYHQLYTMSSWHANFLFPGAKAQKLHLDAAVPEPIPPWIIRVNASFIIEEHRRDNGCTHVVPGSHKACRRPTDMDLMSADGATPIEAKEGALVLWNGHLWHQSGENKSAKPRAALLACYCASHLLEMSLEENHPLVIAKHRQSQMSAPLQRLFALRHGIK